MMTCFACGHLAAVAYIGGYRCQLCGANFMLGDALNILSDPTAPAELRIMARLTVVRPGITAGGDGSRRPPGRQPRRPC